MPTSPTPQQRLDHARTLILAIAAGPWRQIRDALTEAEQFLADTETPKTPAPKRGHRW